MAGVRRIAFLLLALVGWAAGAVSSTTQQVQYTGTGAIATYQCPFYFINPTDLVVTENVNGVITTETYVTNYTVAGAGILSGGSITLTAGNLASGTILTIARQPPLTQSTTYQAQGPIPASSLNNSLDWATMQIQGLQGQASRSLQFPFGDAPANAILPSASLRAGTFLGFDASGNVTTSPTSAPAGLSDWISSQNYKPVPNGTTDSTTMLQAWISALPANGGMLTIPAGSAAYMISRGLDFTGKNNVLIISNGATIRFLPGTADTAYGTWPTYGQDSVFRFNGNTGVTIQGVYLDGNIQNRTAHATTESFNSCLLLGGCSAVCLRDDHFLNGMTDGVTVVYNGTPTTCADVMIEHCLCDSNRRNGISLIGCNKGYIHNCTLTNTGISQGVAPEAGLDIEPESSAVSAHIGVVHNYLDLNQGQYALQLSGTGTTGLWIQDNDVLVSNQYGIDCDSYSGSSNYSKGVRVLDNRIAVSGTHGGTQQGGIRVNQTNADEVFHNTITGGFLSGIQAYNANGLVIDDNYVTGDFFAIYAGDNTNPYLNLRVSRNKMWDNTFSTGPWFACQFAPASATAQLVFDGNWIWNSTGAAHQGDGAVMAGSFINTSQAMATNNTGYNLLDTYSVCDSNFRQFNSMALDGARRFQGLANNCTLNFESGSLVIGDKYHFWTNTGAAPTGSPSFGGTWAVGDIVWNVNPSSGVAAGWICTAWSSDPGTWQPFGAVGHIGAYAQVSQDVSAGAAITITTAGTYYQWTTGSLGLSSLVTLASGQLVIGATAGGTYTVRATASVKGANSGNTVMAVRKNGTPVAAMTARKTEAGTALPGQMAAGGLITCAATDTLDVAFTSNTNGDTVTVYDVSLDITSTL